MVRLFDKQNSLPRDWYTSQHRLKELEEGLEGQQGSCRGHLGRDEGVF